MPMSKFFNIKNFIHIWIYFIMETLPVQKLSDSDCYTLSSEPFRIYLYYLTVFFFSNVLIL
jgi:hypothetical protein